MRHPLWLCAALLCGCGRAEPSLPLMHTTSAVVPVAEASAEAEPRDPPRDAERVVARLRPRFRACYERGLSGESGAMSGVVVLHLRVAPDGSVRDVEIMKRAGLSSRVAACIVDQARSAQFEAPGAPGATLDVPVHLVRSVASP